MSHLFVSDPLPRSVFTLGWHELRHRPRRAVAFLFAGAAHAASHGAVAWCAGNLGRSLVGVSLVIPVLGAVSPSDLAYLGLGAITIKGAAGIFTTFAQTRLAGAAGETLRNAAIHTLLSHGLQTSSPTAVARLVSRVREAEYAVYEGAFASLRSIAQLIPILIALWLVSQSLTALSIITLVPFAIFLAKARRRWRKQHAATMQTTDELHEEMDDLVRHADLWRTYGTGHHARNVLRRLGKRMTEQRARSETLRSTLSSGNEVLGALALVLALLAASRWDLLRDGNLIAFAAIFFMAYRPLRDLGDARSWVIRGNDALGALATISDPQQGASPGRQPTKVHEHVDPPREVRAGGAPPSEGPAPTAPKLETLTASHLQVPHLTPSLSFNLPEGTSLAIVGPTGVGKTTLLRALMGLEPHATGTVVYGDRNLTPGQVGPDVRPFAWVPQDAPVVSGSLADNFLLAAVDESAATSELATIGAAGLHADLADAKLGSGGRTISGGERRWIALARALASRLPVLVLDEPTVGLDAQARERVLGTLQIVRGHRSVIIVTHSQKVASVADQLIRLDAADVEA